MAAVYLMIILMVGLIQLIKKCRKNQSSLGVSTDNPALALVGPVASSPSTCTPHVHLVSPSQSPVVPMDSHPARPGFHGVSPIQSPLIDLSSSSSSDHLPMDSSVASDTRGIPMVSPPARPRFHGVSPTQSPLIDIFSSSGSDPLPMDSPVASRTRSKTPKKWLKPLFKTYCD